MSITMKHIDGSKVEINIGDSIMVRPEYYTHSKNNFDDGMFFGIVIDWDDKWLNYKCIHGKVHSISIATKWNFTTVSKNGSQLIASLVKRLATIKFSIIDRKNNQS